MNKKENRETLEIDIRRVLYALWSRAWIILLVGILIGMLAFGYAKVFITPTYTSSAQFYVNNNYDSLEISSSQIDAAQNLAYTYMVILESRNVLNDVAKQANLGYSAAQIKEMIYSKALNSTEVFEVAVTCTDYKHSAIIANAIAKVLPDKIAAVVEGSSVRVVDYAEENPNPVGPNYDKYLTLGALIGFVLSAIIVVVTDLLDTTIKSEEYLAHAHGNLPLLAVIPGAESSKSGYYKGYYEYTPKIKTDTKERGGKK